MALSIDDVRNSKFRLARRNGYEPVDVDNFADAVESTLNELYKKIEDAQAGNPVADESEAMKAKDDEIAALKAGVEKARSGESEDATKLRADLDAERAKVEELTKASSAKDAELQAFRDAQAKAGEGEGKTEHLVLTSGPEASSAVTRLLEMATKQADDLTSGAKADADRIRSEAQESADKVRADATAHADQVNKDADDLKARLENQHRERQERLDAEHAQKKADLDAEITDRRNTLVTTLEEEHGRLAEQVGSLREYEKTYRESLVAELSAHLDKVKNGNGAPEETPELLDRTPGEGSTPKLDGLLKDEKKDDAAN